MIGVGNLLDDLTRRPGRGKKSDQLLGHHARQGFAGGGEIARGNEAPQRQRATNLLYGPGSAAWSLTFTPTYQHGVFYARGEASYTAALDAAPGDTFGRSLDTSSQARLMLETGVVF